MLFFLLLLAFLTLAVGLGHTACALRVLRNARPWRWVDSVAFWEGTGKARAIDRRGVALSALQPGCDRSCALLVVLALRALDGRPSSAIQLSATPKGDTSVKKSLRRSCTGWSLTKLFTSGLQRTACTYRSKVALAATGDVPLLWC